MDSKSMPLVSVVVPVYNTERFLKRCIKSVVAQKYKNIEIILVDDGSTDKSSEMCDVFANEYKNILVFHTENRGQSHARNYGVKKSKGKYISFIDSDDYIAPDMIGELVGGCEENNAEIGWTNKIRISPDKKEHFEKINSAKETVNPEKALSLLLSFYDPSPCNKIYEKKLFNNIAFPNGRVYEDILTVPRLIDASNRVYLDDRYGYYYTQNDRSTIHSVFSNKKLDYLYAAKWLYEFILKKYPRLKMVAESFYILSLTTILTEIYSVRSDFKNEYNEVLLELKKFKKRYLHNPYIPRVKKMMVFMDSHGMISTVNFIKKMRYRGRFN